MVASNCAGHGLGCDAIRGCVAPSEGGIADVATPDADEWDTPISPRPGDADQRARGEGTIGFGPADWGSSSGWDVSPPWIEDVDPASPEATTQPGPGDSGSSGSGTTGKWKIVGAGTVVDTLTGLLWTHTPVFENNPVAAAKYCAMLDFAGQTDWRLPLIQEVPGHGGRWGLYAQ